MISGVVIGKYCDDHLSTFTSIFCKNTHVGIWKYNKSNNSESIFDEIDSIDSDLYEVLMVDLLIIEPPKLFKVRSLDDPILNQRAVNLEYRNYSSYQTDETEFPSTYDIPVIDFEGTNNFVKSLMSGEMFGFEAIVKLIYKMYPSLQSKITTISDIFKYGKTYKTVNSKFADNGANFASRNINGDYIEDKLKLIRSTINIHQPEPYIDIKTLMSELYQIEILMAPKMSDSGLTFDDREITENNDERSKQCILVENARSFDKKLSIKSNNNNRRSITITTMGDELDSLSYDELKQIHAYLTTSKFDGNSHIDSYTQNTYIDKIVLRISDAIDKHRLTNKSSKTKRVITDRNNSDEYMSISYLSSKA